MDSVSETRHIFNEGFSAYSSSIKNDSTAFPQFTRLPAELRLRIWTLCLPPRRLISIRISHPGRSWPQADAPELSTGAEPYTDRNELGNIISSYPYRVHVPKFEQWSRALLGATRESRQAYLAFSRLSVPLQPGSEEVLRLNPDADILEVQMEQLTPVLALVAFLHDTMAHDPAGRGVAHLALGRNINDLSLLAKKDPSDLHPVAVGSMKRLISTSLQTFYSIISPGIEARNMLGQFSWPRSAFHHNRSVPIAAQGTQSQATAYSLLVRDPRPIEVTDLSHVAVGTDPRRHVFHWYKVLANFGVELPPQQVPGREELEEIGREELEETEREQIPARKLTTTMQIHYLMAIWPEKWNGATDTRNGFTDFLSEADARFVKCMSDLKKPLWGDRIDEETHGKLEKELGDVAGFWVFDSNTFGDIPTPGEGQIDWQPKMVMDLTASRPALGVFHLR